MTTAAYGHILTNIGCWSQDSQWIYYDTRSDAAGSLFDGRWIERVHLPSGRVERIIDSQRGANCGVVTCCPVTERIVFILGPESPTADWQYAPYHRRGVLYDTSGYRGQSVSQADCQPLDAHCYAPPFVTGALRGGSHVHTFDPLGQRVAFTYEDHVLATLRPEAAIKVERNQRNIGISLPGRSVTVPKTHPRNHSGTHFSVIVTETVEQPLAGSDQIDRAYEDAWLGQQGRRMAFLGDIVSASGARLTELFVLELPEDLTQPGSSGPLEGSATLRPKPPRGVHLRRLSHTEHSPYPGMCTPRHWPRSTPDGQLIFCLMRDSSGLPQLWSVKSAGGDPQPVTRIPEGVASAFSVSGDGQWVAFISGGCIYTSSLDGRQLRRLTEPMALGQAPRPEACVFSPDGSHIAYVRAVGPEGQAWNQVFVVSTS